MEPQLVLTISFHLVIGEVSQRQRQHFTDQTFSALKIATIVRQVR
jgi:hypothetical protein